MGIAKDKHRTRVRTEENITTYREHLPTTDRTDLRRAVDQVNLNDSTRQCQIAAAADFGRAISLRYYLFSVRNS